MLLKLKPATVQSNSTIEYPSLDYLAIKNAIHGYTSVHYTSPPDYQKHLTEVQIVIKSNRKPKPLYEIITNFFNYDFKKQPNWNNIKTRVGIDKLSIYEDFLLRINPYNQVSEPILFSKCPPRYSQMGTKDQNDFEYIKDILKKYAEKLSVKNLDDILQNKALKTPVVWTGSQYAFDYFIKNLLYNKRTYKEAIPHYFTFPDGPASVRHGGYDHDGKYYVNDLGSVIKIIKKLIV